MTEATLPPPTDLPAIPAAAARLPRVGPADLVAAAVLLLGSLVIYAQVDNHDFVNYDDQGYIYQNAHIGGGLSMENVRWAMTANVLGNYHPLTELVQLTIVSLFGMRPGPFHAVNLALHAGSTVLLFAFLRRATGRYWPAVLATALWAWHPLRVESVAWASELKDVLCGFCTLLTLLAYVEFTRTRRVGGYAAVFGLLALALAAKPMAVTVPAVLLLLDGWPLNASPRRPWWRLVAEKVPLFALAGLDAWYAAHLQTISGSAANSPIFTLVGRITNALASVLTYLRQTIWPSGLAVTYPHPAMLGHGTPILTVAAAVIVILGLTALAVAYARRVPAGLVGWLWFLGMLVPVIGLIQLGEQAHSDRYTYLPSIGLTMAIVWAAAAAVDAGRSTALARAATGIGGALAVVALGVAAVNVTYWRSTPALFDHASTVVPDNYTALAIEADDMQANGNGPAALALAHRAVDLAGGRSSVVHVALGQCLLATGRDADVDDAVKQFLIAVKIRNIDPWAWSGLGEAIVRQADVYAAQGKKADAARRVNDAVNAFRRTMALNPDDPGTPVRLADLLANNGRQDEAMAVWHAVLAKYPDNGRAHGTLADALMRAGDLQGAFENYRAAVTGPDAQRVPRWEAEYAYQLATNPGAPATAVAAALPLADDAVEQTKSADVGPLEAQAAARARLNMVDLSVESETKALAAARAGGSAHQVEQIAHRLDLYRQGQAYMAPVPTTAPTTGPATAPVTPGPARP